MEKRDRLVIEILLGVVLIVFLILLIFLVIGIYDKNDKNYSSTYATTATRTTTATASTTKYITYPIHTRTRLVYHKPYIVDHYYNGKIYYIKDDYHYYKNSDRPLRYHDWSRYRVVEGVLGNDIERYEVYVRNQDYVGGYFTVKFYFEDYYGRIDTDSITYYISPNKEKRFLYKDISPDYKYKRWWYEVTPVTKTPTKVYYN